MFEGGGEGGGRLGWIGLEGKVRDVMVVAKTAVLLGGEYCAVTVLASSTIFIFDFSTPFFFKDFANEYFVSLRFSSPESPLNFLLFFLSPVLFFFFISLSLILFSLHFPHTENFILCVKNSESRLGFLNHES